MAKLSKDIIEKWSVKSSDAEGFHHCVRPEDGYCKVSNIFRLNMKANTDFVLESKEFEMNPVLIKGKASIKSDYFSEDMNKLDSFFIPGKCTVSIHAVEDCIFYIGAAVCEGHGEAFFRKFDLSLPLGDIHQIHGSGAGEREVFFTLNPEKKSSRLLCGITWGNQGGWTSWPPHQHEKDLEEVYCYFDIEAPNFGLHISYTEEGNADDLVAHVVRGGTMVLAPQGYHPTVASPSVKNSYFWVLVAHSHESRRYDLAKNDKNFL